MKLEQLEQIVEIADTGSFNQAARNLYTSQPNLSASVKHLEEELDQTIFRRASGGVTLTDFGIGFVEHARMVLKQYQLTENFCRNAKSNQRPSLRVATLNLYSVFSPFLRLLNKYADSPYDFSFRNYMSLDETVQEILTCRADIAVIGMISPFVKSAKIMFQNNKIEYHLLTKAQICAAVGPKNPLYHHEGAISRDDLKPYMLVSYDDDQSDPSFSLGHLLGLNDIARGNVYLNIREAMDRIIAETTAVGLLVPLKSKSSAIHRQLHILPFEESSYYAEIGWIKLRRLSVSDMMEEYLSYIREDMGLEE